MPKIRLPGRAAFLAAAWLFYPASVFAAPPQKILYQGTLRRSGSVYTGNATFVFRLTDSSGATEYWTSGSTVVPVSLGLFRYPIGIDNAGGTGLSGKPLSGVDWPNITPFIEVTVDGTVLTPREAMASVPYALSNEDTTKLLKAGDAMTGPLTLSGSTLTISGNAFSVGGSSFTVFGGSATVAYSLSAGSFVGSGSALTGIPSTASIVGVYAPLSGASFTGNVVGAGSITASAFFGYGGNLTGLPSSETNTYVSSKTFTSSVLSAGSVTASAFFGYGGNLTGLPSAETNTYVSSKTFTTSVLSGGSVTASAFFGYGGNLSGIVAAEANTYASSKTFTGNVLSGGSVTASAFFGYGGNLTGLPPSEINTYTSSKTFTADSFSVGGSSFTVSGGSATVAYRLSAGSFAGDGSALTGIPSTASISGTYLAKAGDAMTGPLTLVGSTLTVSGNAFSVGASTFVVTGGNVGIGTTNPGARLAVNGGAFFDTSGTASVTRNITLKSGGSQIDWGAYPGNWAPGLMLQGVTGAGAESTANFLFLSALDDVNEARITSTKGLDFYNGAGAAGVPGALTLSLSSGSRVGIGTTNPAYRLDIQGDVRSTGVFVGSGAGLTNITATQMTAAGLINGPVNSAILPSTVAYTTSANTFTSSQTITASAFSVGGSTLVVAGGNVGVGIAGPLARLHVSTDGVSAATSVLLVSTGSAAGSDVLVIKGDGSVGIGTTAPTSGYRLDVAGNLRLGTGAGQAADRVALKFKEGGYANPAVNSDSAGEKLVLYDSGASYKTAIGMDGNGDMWFQGNLGFRWWTGATPTQVMSFTSGKLGIGDVSPAYRLDVGGPVRVQASSLTFTEAAAPPLSAADQGAIYFDSTANKFKISEHGGAYVDLVSSASAAGWTRAGNLTYTSDSALIQSTLTVGGNAFSVGGSTLVASGGNVGIGTSAPGVKLDVNGSAQIYGTNGSAALRVVADSIGRNIRTQTQDYNGTNTGTYFNAEFGAGSGDTYGTLQVMTNGGSVGGTLALNASGGNVGVGTTVPSATLHVSSAATSGTTPVMVVSSGIAAGQQLLVVQARGAVGIGTSNPGAMLTVSSVAAAQIRAQGWSRMGGAEARNGRIEIGRNAGERAVLEYDNQGSGGSNGTLYIDSEYGATNSAIYLRTWALGGPTQVSTLSWNNNLLKISPNINDGTSRLLFQVASSTFAVNSLGQVGIGTTAPAYSLDVQGDVRSTGVFIGNGSGLTNINVASLSGSPTFSTLTVTGNAFSVGGSTLVATGGRVGVGTTSPGGRLDVTGELQAAATPIQQMVSSGAVLINFGHGTGGYVPGLSWYARDNYATKPRAGIWLNSGGAYSSMYFGTSNDYSAGITNTAMTLDGTGNAIFGAKIAVGTVGPATPMDVTAAAHATATSIQTAVSSGAYAVNYDASGDPKFVPGLSWYASNNYSTLPRAAIWLKDLGGNSSINFGTTNSPDLGITNTAMMINPSGNVGVGTTNALATLHVSSAPTSGNTVLFQVGGGTIAALGSGNVGIGTTNPGGKLHISDELADDTTAALRVQGYWGNSGNNADVYFSGNLAGGGANRILFKLEDTNPSAGGPWGSLIRAFGDIEDDGNASSSDAVFDVSSNGSSYFKGKLDVHSHTGPAVGALAVSSQNAAGMFIVRGDGNVGIGTSVPGYRLDIQGDVRSTGVFIGNGSGLTNISVASLSGSPTFSTLTVTGNAFSVGGSTFVVMGGRVGVGTSSPTTDLEVYSSKSSFRPFFATGDTTYSADGTYYDIGGSFRAFKTVNTGVTDSGYVIALDVDARAQGAQSGILQSLMGQRLYYGVTGSETVNDAHGITIQQASGSGSITNNSAISIAGPAGAGTNFYGINIGAAGANTITNKWGIYQAGSTMVNYFAGNVGVGTTNALATLHVSSAPTSGSTVLFQVGGGTIAALGSGNVGIGTVSPAAKFEVNGSASFGGGVAKSTFSTNGDLTMGGGQPIIFTASNNRIFGSGTDLHIQADDNIVFRTDNDVIRATFTANGSFVTGASVTASAFFGSGSALTGIPSTASISGSYVAKGGDSMAGQLTLAGSSLTVAGTGGALVGIKMVDNATMGLRIKTSNNALSDDGYLTATGGYNTINLSANGYYAGGSSRYQRSQANLPIWAISMTACDTGSCGSGINQGDQFRIDHSSAAGDVGFANMTTPFWINYNDGVIVGPGAVYAPSAGFQVGTSSLVVLQSGNVGLGTNSPVLKLDVNGGAQFGSGVNKSTISATGAITMPAWTNFSMGATGYPAMNGSGGVLLIYSGATTSMEFYGTSLYMGADNRAVPVAYTISGEGASGATNATGGDLIIRGGLGTGTGAGGALILQTAPAFGASGTTLDIPVERLRVTPTGSVGIGTSNPGARLEVSSITASGAFNAIISSVNTTVGGWDPGIGFDLTYVAPNSYAPIGIKATVTGNYGTGQRIIASTQGQQIDAAGTPAWNWYGGGSVVGSYINTSGQGLKVVGTPSYGVSAERIANTDITDSFIARRARGDIATPAYLNSGDLLGTMSFEGWSNSNGANYMVPTGYSPGAQIKSYATAASAENSVTGDLRFYTTSAGITPLERLRITSAGNVGIGTTNPAATLHVSSAPTSGGSLLFQVGGGTISATGAGNVGIGTTAPAEKLHIVDGNIKISTTSGSKGIIFQDGTTQTTAASGATLAASTVGYIAAGTASQITTTDCRVCIAGSTMTMTTGGSSRVLMNIAGNYAAGAAYWHGTWLVDGAFLPGFSAAFGNCGGWDNSSSMGTISCPMISEVLSAGSHSFCFAMCTPNTGSGPYRNAQVSAVEIR